MNRYPTLTPEQIDRLKAAHPVVDVLARLGLPEPDGASRSIPCPSTGHEDSNPSAVVYPPGAKDPGGHVHCYGCGFHADTIDLVREVTGLRGLGQVAQWLEGTSTYTATTARAARATTSPRAEESPWRTQVTRTSAERVMAANAAAWEYWTVPKLEARAMGYLTERGVPDASALRGAAGPIVGHTPASSTGLVEQLTRRGFTAAEIIDAGLGFARDPENVPPGGQPELVDTMRRRVVFPLRDVDGRIRGFAGRDVSGLSGQEGSKVAKYRNTGATAAYTKGDHVYRPSPARPETGKGAVVLVEGYLDAIAIAAAAHAAGGARQVVPIATGGTALTDRQADVVAAVNGPGPVMVCGDADEAGRHAAAAWATACATRRMEVVHLTLPDGHDPASWLRAHPGDLVAFQLAGCLTDPGDGPRAQLAGDPLARALIDLAAKNLDAEPTDPRVRAKVLAQLDVIAAHMPSPSARERFTTSAEAGVVAATGAGRTSVVGEGTHERQHATAPARPLLPG